MADEFIFVYGSLRKPLATPMFRLLAEHCDYYADALMQGRLYEVNGYPGALASADPQDQVRGELYRIIRCESVLAQLDDYEQCTDDYPLPHEYVRTQQVVLSAAGVQVCAWVYLYNHDVSQLQQIHSGDYLRFVNARNGGLQEV